MLTLEQLYKLGESQNINIFDALTLPVDSPFNRTTLINTIIMKCGLNYPVYADPYVMKSAIAVWSAKSQYTFEHLGKILTAEYNPIDNKDYYEETTTTRERDLVDNTTGNTKKSDTSNVSSDKTTSHSGTDKTIDEQTTSAYNTTSYQPDDKTTTEIIHGEVIKDGGKGETKSNSNLDTQTDKKVDEDEKTTIKTHQRGNIGVTSFFDIQRGEYELMNDYNPYNFIAGLFENELTLCVY